MTVSCVMGPSAELIPCGHLARLCLLSCACTELHHEYRERDRSDI